jgi:hypothetical protein
MLELRRRRETSKELNGKKPDFQEFLLIADKVVLKKIGKNIYKLKK